MHFGGSLRVHMCYFKQPFFRTTSVTDRSSYEYESMLTCHLYPV